MEFDNCMLSTHYNALLFIYFWSTSYTLWSINLTIFKTKIYWPNNNDKIYYYFPECTKVSKFFATTSAIFFMGTYLYANTHLHDICCWPLYILLIEHEYCRDISSMMMQIPLPPKIFRTIIRKVLHICTTSCLQDWYEYW